MPELSTKQTGILITLFYILWNILSITRGKPLEIFKKCNCRHSDEIILAEIKSLDNKCQNA